MTAEEAWNRFIEHLNKVQPMKDKDASHINFMGSIASYKKIFMAANSKS
jgi:phage terminase small subunit